MNRKIRWMVGVGLLAAALSRPALMLADDHDNKGERDHDRARGAVERGDILPLETILAAIRPSIKGEIVGVDLEKEDGRWIYEFKVIDRRGRMLEIQADAKLATVLRIEGD